MGRPKIELDEALILRLARLGCIESEIASCCNCSVDTLHNRCSAVIKKGWDSLDMSLRRWQVRAAKKGSIPMLIWLGKQRLKQREPATIITTDNQETVFKTLGLESLNAATPQVPAK
jgi:hypothetical protein